MTNKKSSFSYILNNIWWVAGLVLVPSILLALSTLATQASIYEFWQNYFASNNMTIEVFLRDINKSYMLFIKLGTWRGAIFDLLFIITLAFGWSAMVFRANRHMQLGILVGDNLISRISKIFWRMLDWLVCMVVVVQVVLALIVGLAHLLSMYFTLKAVVIITMITTVVGLILLVLIFSMFSVVMPIIVSEDYRLNVALSYAARLSMLRKNRNYALRIICMMAVVILFTAVFALINPPMVVSLICFATLFVVCLASLPILACVQYMDDMSYERKDLSKFF